MTLIWHILKKDLRLLRWVLSVWLALSLLDTINRVVSPRLVAENERWMFVLPMWVFIITLAFTLQLVLLIANHIQAERLVGTTAFWLTRPIPRGTLLCSKLLGLTLFVLLPTLLLETILMAAFHVPLRTIVFAWIEQAWSMALLVLALVFAATLTATATRMLFLLLGVLVGLYVVFLAMLSVAMTRPSTFETSGPHTDVSDPTAQVISLTIAGIALLVAIWHHYTRRRPFVAVTMATAGIAIAFLAGSLWPDVSMFGGLPTVDGETWAREARLRVPTNQRNFIDTRSFSGAHMNDRRMTQVTAPLVLDGVPSNYTADAFTMAAQVRFADGRMVRSQKAGAEQRQVKLNATVSTPPGPGDYIRIEYWPTLMLAPVEDFQQDGDRAGQYSGTFIYTVHRQDQLTVTPLTEGAGYQDGPRSLFVSKLGYDVSVCRVTFRSADASLMRDQLSRPTLVPRFRQRDGLELRDQRGADGFSMGLNSIGAGNTTFFSPHLLRVFEMDYRLSLPTLPVPNGMNANGPPCDQIEMIIERRTFAGTLTRTLDLPDFRLNDGRPATTPANVANLVRLP